MMLDLRPYLMGEIAEPVEVVAEAGLGDRAATEFAGAEGEVDPPGLEGMGSGVRHVRHASTGKSEIRKSSSAWARG